MNASLASDNQFSEESMWEAFQLVGHRPEVLRQIVSKVAIQHDASSFGQMLRSDAKLWHNQVWKEFENDFNTLPPLQQTILVLLIEQGRAWSPFSQESMEYYRDAIDQPQLSISTVQTAIQSLREQGFIWQSSRGAYALEDDSFAEWFQVACEAFA